MEKGNSVETQKTSQPSNEREYPFLAQWRMQNFKSVHDATINLAPLTVLVGPNSAGKSSLLQSILLFAQNSRRTMREFDSNSRGGIILNGDLVKLGSIEESRSDLEIAKSQDIRIGAKFIGGKTRGKLTRRNSFTNKSKDVDALEWNVSLINEPGTSNSGTAIVGEVDLQIYSSEGKTEQAKVKFTNGSHLDSEIPIDRGNFSARYLGLLNLKSSHPATEIVMGPSSNSDFVYQGMSFIAGLPANVARLMTSLEVILQGQKRSFSTEGFLLNDLLADRVKAKDSEILEKDEAIQICIKKIRDRLENNKDGEPESKYARISMIQRLTGVEEPIVPLFRINWLSLSQVINQTPEIDKIRNEYFSMKTVIEERIQEELSQKEKTVDSKADYSRKHRAAELYSSIEFQADELNEKLSKWATDDLDSQLDKEMKHFWLEVIENSLKTFHDTPSINTKTWNFEREEGGQINEWGPSMFQAVQSWNSQLASGVLYLEPLREAPKPFYSFESGGSISPQIPIGSKGEHLGQRLYDQRPMVFPLPNDLMNTKIRVPLIEAVNLWLAELKIEGPIRVDPQGRSGFLLTVGGRVLPMLGTGISQVLPVLTLCLLARRGDLVLLEQPELHLNPSMQQLLADFLLSMSKTGRQIIVETHSEYLVTRLRLNTISDEENVDIVKILFVEKDAIRGTTYNEIVANQYGEIQNWPKGFFDQASNDYRKLIMKIAEKKETHSK